MSATNTTNGHFPEGGDVARRSLEELNKFGTREARPEGDLFQDQLFPTDDAPKHGQERHPEDPSGALEDAAIEVRDPERIRLFAARLGLALQAIPQYLFDRWIRRLYTGVRGVRAGAIIGPAQTAAADQLKIVESTDEAVAQVLLDGYADAKQADRKEKDALPRAEQKIAACDKEAVERKAERIAAEEAVAKGRPEDGKVDQPHGDLWGWVQLAAWLALVLFGVDVTITTINLQPEVSNLFAGINQFTSYLIAGGISATLIGSSAMAGFALAAIRLSGRVVGGLFVALFLVLLVKLTGGLDAIRTGSTKGIETLTATTLAACYVAGMTGYAAAAFRDFKRQRREVMRGGTRFGDLLDKRDTARQNERKAETDKDQAVTDRNALLTEIEQLRDRAARSFSKALSRQAVGTAAQVEFAKIKALCQTWVDQEVSAHDVWCVAIASLAREKARAEKLPQGNEIRSSMSIGMPVHVEAQPGLTLLQKLAIAVLGLGAVLGFVVGPLALSIAAGVAAALLLLGDWRRFAVRGHASKADVPSKRPPIGSPASDDDLAYIHQPDHTVAKYTHGGAPAGERQ